MAWASVMPWKTRSLRTVSTWASLVSPPMYTQNPSEVSPATARCLGSKPLSFSTAAARALLPMSANGPMDMQLPGPAGAFNAIFFAAPGVAAAAGSTTSFTIFKVGQLRER